MKLRINTKNKSEGNTKDKTDTYGNKFIIPLDFEMLDSTMPYYGSIKYIPEGPPPGNLGRG